MRSSAYRSNPHSVPSSRLVAIDSRKHIPPVAQRTRIGVGEAFFDHAAGRPLSTRQSFQGIDPGTPRYEDRSRHYVMPPVAPTDWDEEQASIHDSKRLRDAMYANDAPVDLPLKSRGRMYLVVGGLVAAFIAMLVGTFFAGASSSVEELNKKPAAAPASEPIGPAIGSVPQTTAPGP